MSCKIELQSILHWKETVRTTKVANVDEKLEEPILTGRAWKVGVEVLVHFPDIWKALEAMKRQDGLGASPKWQRRPERPYDSGTDSDTNSDRESLESLLRRFHCGLER